MAFFLYTAVLITDQWLCQWRCIQKTGPHPNESRFHVQSTISNGHLQMCFFSIQLRGRLVGGHKSSDICHCSSWNVSLARCSADMMFCWKWKCSNTASCDWQHYYIVSHHLKEVTSCKPLYLRQPPKNALFTATYIYVKVLIPHVSLYSLVLYEYNKGEVNSCVRLVATVLDPMCQILLTWNYY